jgi:hypothetical protein
MNRQPLHYLTGGAAIVLCAALVGACGSGPVQPIPGQSGGAPSASASASRSTPPTTGTTTPPAPPASPTKHAPKSPKPTSACLGAVVYTVSGDPSDQWPKSLCMKAGGVLRIEQFDPHTPVSVVPAGSASTEYEAGILSCRFIRPGTVTVEAAFDSGTRSITVVVVS